MNTSDNHYHLIKLRVSGNHSHLEVYYGAKVGNLYRIGTLKGGVG